MVQQMKSYTGIEGYKKLTQIYQIVNSQLFKTFETAFFKNEETILKKNRVIDEGINRTYLTLKSLTTDEAGQPIARETVLSDLNRAIDAEKTKIKQAALKQKQWNSTKKYGIGLGIALPVLEALFLNDGNLPIRLFVFSLVATTALAASIFYGCGKRIFKQKEFDKADQRLTAYIEKDFADYFKKSREFKLERYAQKFKVNPENSPLLLTMQETVEHARALREQGKAMSR